MKGPGSPTSQTTLPQSQRLRPLVQHLHKSPLQMVQPHFEMIWHRWKKQVESQLDVNSPITGSVTVDPCSVHVVTS